MRRSIQDHDFGLGCRGCKGKGLLRILPSMILRRIGRRYGALTIHNIVESPVDAFRMIAGFTAHREVFVTLDICRQRSILSGFEMHIGERRKGPKRAKGVSAGDYRTGRY
jgi:hypothetical protein